MKDLPWYAVLGDITSRVMDGVTIEKVSPSSITYKRKGARSRTIELPPDSDVHIAAYGTLIAMGYVIVPSPDNSVYLCSGGAAVYSVTPNSCTCPAHTYDSAPCKHIYMLLGYLAYSNKAITLRKGAME